MGLTVIQTTGYYYIIITLWQWELRPNAFNNGREQHWLLQQKVREGLLRGRVVSGYPMICTDLGPKIIIREKLTVIPVLQTNNTVVLVIA